MVEGALMDCSKSPIEECCAIGGSSLALSGVWTANGDHYVTCPLCLGTGKIVRTARTTSKGEIFYRVDVCPECLGKGFVKVRIQVGSSNGSSE